MAENSSRRRSFFRQLLGVAGFAVPTIRTLLMTSAATPRLADASGVANCPAGFDISTALANPFFLGNPPFGWIIGGSPAPGFATYVPAIPTQYFTLASPLPSAAYSPTGISGSGVIRQNTTATWVGGTTYVLQLWIGLPWTKPDGKTPVAGWPGTVRLYFTAGPGFAQVWAIDIPDPPPGEFVLFPITYTLPKNSPAIGQTLGIMIFVDGSYNQQADFAIANCVGVG